MVFLLFFIVFLFFLVFKKNPPPLYEKIRGGIVGASPPSASTSRSPSRPQCKFLSSSLLKTITNVPLGALPAYKAFSFQIPYLNSLQMCLSEPFAPIRHFPLLFLIKKYYKCAPRSLSRLKAFSFRIPY